MSSTEKRHPELPALTGIRFFAALAVVVYHFGQRLFSSVPIAFNIAQVGYVGVSFFFILSGFVMIYVYNGERDEPGFARRYLAARLARIYPVYAISLIISAPLYIIQLAAKNGSVAFIGKFFIAAASRFTLMHAWSGWLLGYWNNPSWTLSVEWFFYVVFALSFAAKLAKRWPIGPAATALGLWGVMLAIGGMAYFFGQNLGSMPPLYLPQFLLGICIGKVWLARRTVSPGWAGDVAVIGTILVLSAARRVPDEFWQYGGLSFIFAPLIFFLAGSNGIFARLLSSRPLVFLGEASYGVYILHWPVWEICSATARAWEIATDTNAFILAYISITIAASALSFALIEKPARRFLREWLTAKPIQTSRQ